MEEYITCKICRFGYYFTDKGEKREHDRLHRKFTPVLEPKPLSKITYSPGDTFIEVFPYSRSWMHTEMYNRARVLGREEGYSGVMWSLGSESPEARGFLIYDITGIFEPGSIIGACSFRNRGDYWALQWVWFCPGVRGKGVLKTLWPEFTDRFGAFVIEWSLSDGMKAFMAKNNIQNPIG